MRVKKYIKRVLAVQRRAAFRVACAYRRVSGAADMVVVGVNPLDLLTVERQTVFRLVPEQRKKKQQHLQEQKPCKFGNEDGKGAETVVGLFISCPIFSSG